MSMCKFIPVVNKLFGTRSVTIVDKYLFCWPIISACPADGHMTVWIEIGRELDLEEKKYNFPQFKNSKKKMKMRQEMGTSDNNSTQRDVSPKKKGL